MVVVSDDNSHYPEVKAGDVLEIIKLHTNSRYHYYVYGVKFLTGDGVDLVNQFGPNVAQYEITPATKSAKILYGGNK